MVCVHHVGTLVSDGLMFASVRSKSKPLCFLLGQGPGLEHILSRPDNAILIFETDLPLMV